MSENSSTSVQYQNPSISFNQNPTLRQNYGTLFTNYTNPTRSQQNLEISPPLSGFDLRFYNINIDSSFFNLFEDQSLERYFATMNLSSTGNEFSRSSNSAQQRALIRMRSDEQYSLAAGYPSYQDSSQSGTRYMAHPSFSNGNEGLGYGQNIDQDQDYQDRFALDSFPYISQNGTRYMAHPSFSNSRNNNGGRGYDQNIRDQNYQDRFALDSFPGNNRTNNGSTSHRRLMRRMRSQSYDALDHGFSVRHNGIIVDDTGSQFRRVRSIDELESSNSNTPWVSSLPSSSAVQSNLPSLDKLKGMVALAAKNKGHYQFLKRVLDERRPDQIEMIFLEVKDHLHDLMADQFGNYVIQKLFEVCSEVQMTQLILSFINNQRRLLGLCFHPVATRAMQKMMERMKTSEQRCLFIPVLMQRIVILSKNENGYHVIVKCLESIPFDDAKHLIKEIVENFLEIAMDKNGCCVLNRALDCAQGELKERLLVKTIDHALFLSQNPFGNFVVQHVLEGPIHRAAVGVLEKLKGHFVALSMNKYGSNVVEKCLLFCGEENTAIIIEEFMHSSNFLNMCRDNFGNYVVQMALGVSKGGIQDALVSRMYSCYPDLYNDIHGKHVAMKLREPEQMQVFLHLWYSHDPLLHQEENGHGKRLISSISIQGHSLPNINV
ncbi:unnamed protein product [Dovyalis caffra]|uniref:PUM-HD domain-containing protein n=1 Tax=Dovyalis caffra TaxID=77055 RepID=A0AAV1RAK6_9ROSI|nr:unnamed protein product [Dovyalis caffra]